MTYTKEPYAYFQQGEIFFFLSQERDQPINPKAKDPETNQLIYAKRRRPRREQSLDSNNEENYNQKEHDGTEDDDDDDDGVPYDEIIENFIGWSENEAKKINPNLRILRVKEREIHFPGTQGEEPARDMSKNVRTEKKNHPPEPVSHGAFSLIPAIVRLAEPGQDPQAEPKGFVKSGDLAKLVRSLDKSEIRKTQPLVTNGITLRAVCPNWLSTSCSETGGGGGPGGIPEPYTGEPKDAHFFDLSHKAGLQAGLARAGKGVTVAILDTAPCLQALAAAYERYYKVNPANKPQNEHLLIKGLLGPDGKLVVHPASIEELLRMRSVHLRDHDYEMSDHGLFIAGIIHTLAGEVKIHLYEVLNSQGVGDLVSIASGFWRVFNRFSREQLVVNASLTLRIPRLNHPIHDFDPSFMAEIIKEWETQANKNIEWLTTDVLSDEGRKWLARQGEAIEWICDHLYYRGSRVIAAAGNDWRSEESSERPDPGFPAGFDRVLGVGALPKNAVRDTTTRVYPVSKYSNLSDESEEQAENKEVGVTTLGGEAGAGKGVLGVYIGEFPDMRYRLSQYHCLLRPLMWVIFTLMWGNCIRPRNKSDWAWWCGTSFATPIIAGLTAAVLSELNQPLRPARTQEAIDTMYDVNGIITRITAYQEDGVEEVKQL